MTATQNKYHEVRYVGSPTTANEKSKALAKDGPLRLAPEHMLAVLLPDALEPDATSGAVSISLLDMNGMALAGMLWAPDAASAGVHGAVIPARWTVMFKDLELAGLDMTPVDGPIETAFPVVRRRVVKALRGLTQAQRTIELDDLFFSGEADNPATDTWYDYITPDLLMASGGGPHVVAQFTSLAALRESNSSQGDPHRLRRMGQS